MNQISARIGPEHGVRNDLPKIAFSGRIPRAKPKRLRRIQARVRRETNRHLYETKASAFGFKRVTLDVLNT